MKTIFLGVFCGLGHLPLSLFGKMLALSDIFTPAASECFGARTPQATFNSFPRVRQRLDQLIAPHTNQTTTGVLVKKTQLVCDMQCCAPGEAPHFSYIVGNQM